MLTPSKNIHYAQGKTNGLANDSDGPSRFLLVSIRLQCITDVPALPINYAFPVTFLVSVLTQQPRICWARLIAATATK